MIFSREPNGRTLVVVNNLASVDLITEQSDAGHYVRGLSLRRYNDVIPVELLWGADQVAGRFASGEESEENVERLFGVRPWPTGIGWVNIDWSSEESSVSYRLRFPVFDQTLPLLRLTAEFEFKTAATACLVRVPIMSYYPILVFRENAEQIPLEGLDGRTIALAEGDRLSVLVRGRAYHYGMMLLCSGASSVGEYQLSATGGPGMPILEISARRSSNSLVAFMVDLLPVNLDRDVTGRAGDAVLNGAELAVFIAEDTPLWFGARLICAPYSPFDTPLATPCFDHPRLSFPTFALWDSGETESLRFSGITDYEQVEECKKLIPVGDPTPQQVEQALAGSHVSLVAVICPSYEPIMRVWTRLSNRWLLSCHTRRNQLWWEIVS